MLSPSSGLASTYESTQRLSPEDHHHGRGDLESLKTFCVSAVSNEPGIGLVAGSNPTGTRS
jgi:hypothetical protein